MSIDVVTAWDGLDAVVEAWADLARTDPLPPTVHPRWYAAAARTLHRKDHPHVVVHRRDGDIVAVAPLARTRGPDVERLELLGSRDLHEPAGLAARDVRAMAALLDAIVGSGRPVYLGRLPEGGAELHRLASYRMPRALTVRGTTSGTPFVATDAGWEIYENALPAKIRSSLRRTARRADEAGGLDFAVLAPSPREVDESFDEFVRVEDGSWKSAAGTSLAQDARRRAFYRLYARLAAAAGELRVSRLRIGGQPAAVQLAVEHAERLWVLKLGFDERWSRCAPGIILTQRTLHWAFDRGLRAYEFLGHEEPWTRAWTTQSRPYSTVRVYPASARSFVALAGDALQRAEKRIKAVAGT